MHSSLCNFIISTSLLYNWRSYWCSLRRHINLIQSVLLNQFVLFPTACCVDHLLSDQSQVELCWTQQWRVQLWQYTLGACAASHSQGGPMLKVSLSAVSTALSTTAGKVLSSKLYPIMRSAMSSHLLSIFLYLSYLLTLLISYCILLSLIMVVCGRKKGYTGLGTVHGFRHPWASTNTSFAG